MSRRGAVAFTLAMLAAVPLGLWAGSKRAERINGIRDDLSAIRTLLEAKK